MKKFLSFFITILILIGANYFAAMIFQLKFIDLAFFIGLIGAVVIRFFNSSGGFMSRKLDMEIQSQTGMKMNMEQKHYIPNIPFHASLTYTIIAAILTFLQYKDYFFN
ncbi:hypothetical protein [Salirhabdus sp. Marseille-P4669]|uniref:hypothetical protein n=1 Tax=Salirhabdus sp. Marseille-P4669 TaxID=2042310 RepID=UPI000C7B0852|nr:hypothetical protein [Salirhabdus sp. Marseille-P4669]